MNRVKATLAAAVLTFPLAVAVAAAQPGHAAEVVPATCPAWTLHSIAPGAATFSPPPAAAGSAVTNSTHVDLTKPFTGKPGDTPSSSNVGGTEFAAYAVNLDYPAGATLDVVYSLSGGADVSAGAVRLFYYHEQGANTISDAPAGFTPATMTPAGTIDLPVTGHVGTIGLVYDASNFALGTVHFGDLQVISGGGPVLAVHFSNDCTPAPNPSSSGIPPSVGNKAPAPVPTPVRNSLPTTG